MMLAACAPKGRTRIPGLIWRKLLQVCIQRVQARFDALHLLDVGIAALAGLQVARGVWYRCAKSLSK